MLPAQVTIHHLVNQGYVSDDHGAMAYGQHCSTMLAVAAVQAHHLALQGHVSF